MNQMILQGKWRQARGRARENWGRFTHNDSHRYAGKADRFIGSVEERFGHTRVRAERELKEFLTIYPIPGAARLVGKPKRARGGLMRRPFFMLIIVMALFMLVRVLAQGKKSSKNKMMNKGRQTSTGPQTSEQNHESTGGERRKTMM